MIKYEMDKTTNLFVEGLYVIVDGMDSFAVALEGAPLDMTRTEIQCLRSLLDQALNTSQEEIDADKTETLRRIYAPVDPARVIPGATVNVEEADRLRSAAKSLESK